MSRSQLTDTEAHADECVLVLLEDNEANIFLGLIEYELNSLLIAPYLVDYISVHIRFDLERYLLIICHTLLLLISYPEVISSSLYSFRPTGECYTGVQ